MIFSSYVWVPIPFTQSSQCFALLRLRSLGMTGLFIYSLIGEYVRQFYHTTHVEAPK